MLVRKNPLEGIVEKVPLYSIVDRPDLDRPNSDGSGSWTVEQTRLLAFWWGVEDEEEEDDDEPDPRRVHRRAGKRAPRKNASSNLASLSVLRIYVRSETRPRARGAILTLVCCVVNWADRVRVPYLAPLQPMMRVHRIPNAFSGVN
jgi:hypothetical protein